MNILVGMDDEMTGPSEGKYRNERIICKGLIFAPITWCSAAINIGGFPGNKRL